MKGLLVLFLLYTLACGDSAPAEMVETERSQRVLVFTRTEGYRHGSISDGVSMIRRLGRANDFKVDQTEDPGRFTSENLERYDAVIFLSTTGDVLNLEQQNAFEAYIRSGKSFVGIHAATDTEQDWPWYGRLVGAYFESHPKVQQAEVRVIDASHPATDFLPDPWVRTDEWYNFKEFDEEVTVLLALDEETYTGGDHGDLHPAAWFREYDGGRSFYTAGGHTDSTFKEPLFEKHVLGGILWALQRE